MKPVRFSVADGRLILRPDGSPLIGIERKGHTSPAGADELTHVIAALLGGAKTYEYCGETYTVAASLRALRRMVRS